MAHVWLWAGLFTIVATVLALDLGVHRHQRGPLSLGAAVGWSLVWIGLSIGFGALVWWRRGADAGTRFYTAWLLEKSLSVDNLVVFMLVFRRFGVAEGDRHRVLSWGVIGAIVLRGLVIVGGIHLLRLWHPIVYGFGAFLAYSGVQAIIHRGEDEPLDQRRWVRALRRRLRVPPLVFVIVVVEVADLLFAVDSIPAVLGVTDDLQIVFSSNVLAILGLRALYLVVERVLDRLCYLRFGIGAILVLVGAKMCLDDLVHVPPALGLAVTVGILAITAAASLLRRRRTATDREPPSPAPRAAPDARAF